MDESSANYPDLLENDTFLERISQIFDGKVGQPYPEEDFSKHCKEAGKRIEKKQPPGYKDTKKNEPEKFGDVIIWFQLIDYAKSEKRPIIFVTDDEKEDWWLDHKGKTIGPRPELIQEMLAKAGVACYLYTGERFLEYAASFLKLEDEPKIVEEAKDVRQQEEAEDMINSEIDHIEVTAGINGINPELLRVSGINPELFRINGINPELLRGLASLGGMASSIRKRRKQHSDKSRIKINPSNTVKDADKDETTD